MRRFINPLLLFAAHSRHADLVRQIQYLKVENQILRAKLPKKIDTTPKERALLVRYARPVGRAISHLVSIVAPVTMRGWLNCQAWGQGTRPRKPGRPRTPAEVEAFVLRVARETGWGYTRILGELKKLDIRCVSRSTVVNILKRAGLSPSPERKKATWDEFIARHAQTLWACDIMQRRVFTPMGWRYAFVLLFINVKTRKAWVSASTHHPTSAWTGEQVAEFMRESAGRPNAPTLVMRDRDARMGVHFEAALREAGAEPVRLPIRSPNLNAYAERFVQTVQQECLDHFMVFGCRHMDHLVNEFLEHYHTERPHQSLGNDPLARAGPSPFPSEGHIDCRTRLGGVLRHYRRAA